MPNALTPATSRCGVRPRPVPEPDRQARLVEPGLRVGGAEVQARRQLPVPDAQRHLQQAGDAGGALQVADVGLRRADDQRVAGRSGRAERVAEGAGLDRVADAGAGAVQLDVLHVGGVEPGAGNGGRDDVCLGLAAGDGQPVGSAVAVHRSAEQHADDVVAVGQRGGQRLEHDDGAALAPDEAVGPGIEGVAAPVR
ncbi:hypothetical protein GCM10027610_059920 [Dactylosporangium cerinum]